jgi:peroxiredoxin
MKLNAPAPNFQLTDTNGKTVSLNEELIKSKAVLLVFLRHLG